MYASKGTMFDRLRERGLYGWSVTPKDQRESLAETIEQVSAVFVVEPVHGLTWPDRIPLPGYADHDHLRQPWSMPYEHCWWEFEANNTSFADTTRCGMLTSVVERNKIPGLNLPRPMAGGQLLAATAFWEGRIDVPGQSELPVGIVHSRLTMLAVVDQGYIHDKFMHHGLGDLSDDNDKNVGWISTYCLRSVHQALALMECKNVEVIRHKAEPRLMKSKKQRRKNEGLPPRYDFHTLRITSGKRIVYDGPGSTDPAMLKAQHLCRGHFKTYTDDAPLFGKFTGRYWWPPHVRGSLEVGLVEKDYEVAR